MVIPESLRRFLETWSVEDWQEELRRLGLGHLVSPPEKIRRDAPIWERRETRSCRRERHRSSAE